jgi:hypothetical protein
VCWLGQYCNCQIVNKYLVMSPRWGSTSRHTDWPPPPPSVAKWPWLCILNHFFIILYNILPFCIQWWYQYGSMEISKSITKCKQFLTRRFLSSWWWCETSVLTRPNRPTQTTVFFTFHSVYCHQEQNLMAWTVAYQVHLNAIAYQILSIWLRST